MPENIALESDLIGVSRLHIKVQSLNKRYVYGIT